MTAKPICVVYIPDNISISSSGRRVDFRECISLMDFWNKERPDYYWFALPDSTVERIDFKVFYEKDFTPIQYEELKKLITDSINNNKTDVV